MKFWGHDYPLQLLKGGGTSLLRQLFEEEIEI